MRLFTVAHNFSAGCNFCCKRVYKQWWIQRKTNVHCFCCCCCCYYSQFNPNPIYPISNQLFVCVYIAIFIVGKHKQNRSPSLSYFSCLLACLLAAAAAPIVKYTFAFDWFALIFGCTIFAEHYSLPPSRPSPSSSLCLFTYTFAHTTHALSTHESNSTRTCWWTWAELSWVEQSRELFFFFFFFFVFCCVPFFRKSVFPFIFVSRCYYWMVIFTSAD